MNAILDILLALTGLLFLLPALLLLLEVAAALLILPPPPRLGPPPSRLAVLVPAHDEADGIAATLADIKAQLLPGDRLLVVADNCTDTTASVARAMGAEVIERRDAKRRGKSYALAFGRRHLAMDPPPVVIVIDADCRLGPNALTLLGRCCLATGRPVQALYRMRSPKEAGWKIRVAEFAWIVRNHVRALGCHGLGLPCQLMGSGMAFPWPLFARVPLASGVLVEDFQLGADCARAGAPPLFCPEARVDSVFPSQEEGIASQRTRWEHGHLAMILGTAPRLFRAALRGRNGALLSLTLDLCVPPLALLVLASFGLLAMGAVLGDGPGPITLAAAPFLCLALAVGFAWQGFGRQVLPFSQLALAPAYALAKIPLYLRFIVRRQVDWVRTRRESEPPRETRHG